MSVHLAHPICLAHGPRPWLADNRSAPHCELCGKALDHWEMPTLLPFPLRRMAEHNVPKDLTQEERRTDAALAGAASGGFGAQAVGA